MPLDLNALKTPVRDRGKLIAFLQQREFKRLLVRIGRMGRLMLMVSAGCGWHSAQ